MDIKFYIQSYLTKAEILKMVEIIQLTKDKQEHELKYNPLTVQPPKSGGVKSRKELNKLLKKERVEDLLGVMPNEDGGYKLYDDSYSWFFPKDFDKKNPHLRLLRGHRKYGNYTFFGDAVWDRVFDGRAAEISVDGIMNDTILKVQYAKDFPSLNGWLRSVLDSSIDNNFDEMWVPKTFKFLIGKATFDYETVEYVGTNQLDAMKAYCKKNPKVKLGFDDKTSYWERRFEDRAFILHPVKTNETFVCAPEPEEGETKAG